MKRLILLLVVLLCSFSCKQNPEQKPEFLEIRITRWTALEGGEIFLMRKVGKDWSAMLFGDGRMLSCFYQKEAKPKSAWNDLWISLQKEGLLEIPDGLRNDNLILDGSGFEVEIYHNNRLKRYVFRNPKEAEGRESKQILKIGDIISGEFNTPLFASDYSRNAVGDYFIENCKDISKVSFDKE